MWFTLKQFIFYFFKSNRNLESFSPFVQKFKSEVLETPIPKSLGFKIEKLKLFYKNESKKIRFEDYGAGSKSKKQKDFLNTKDLVKNVAIPDKYGKVLYNLSELVKAKNVLELGTSLGIGSAYLASGKLTSIEGNQDLYHYTKETLSKNGFEHINFINAKFDDVLENLLSINKFDLIYIDGNHTEEATLSYFKSIVSASKQHTVIVFDDINWSMGMNSAWKSIKANKNVYMTIDLFKFGIAFIEENKKKKEDLVLWY